MIEGPGLTLCLFVVLNYIYILFPSYFLIPIFIVLDVFVAVALNDVHLSLPLENLHHLRLTPLLMYRFARVDPRCIIFCYTNVLYFFINPGLSHGL